MHPAMLWWIATAILVGTELLTGTVYLLVIALGAAAGAVAAHFGLDTTTQMAVAAAVGSAGVILWHLWRRRKKSTNSAELVVVSAPNATRNKLDIGGVVLVAFQAVDGGRAVVSEPLEQDETDWLEVPPQSFCIFEGDRVSQQPFLPDAARAAA